MAEVVNKLNIYELLEKTKAQENDILIIEDADNTKKMTFRNFRDSLIDDDELPSKHRMYSSFKLNEAIEDFQRQLDYDIGEMEGKIEELQTNSITSKSLEERLTEFAKDIPTLVDTEELKKGLDLKRNTSDLITCDDIESGEDAKKIKPRNLSDEVISMMVGTTPVTPPAVPDGGWVQEDIAKGAIIASKLSKQYRFRGHYPEGNIDNFVDDGLYLLGASVIGMPKYDSDEKDQDRLLEVYNFGPNQYIIQKVYYCLDLGDTVRPVYVRKALRNRLHVTEFVAEYPVTDNFKITRNVLDDNFLNLGVISSGNIYDITNDGSYLVKKTVKNLPNDKYDYTISIRKYDTRIEYIAKAITNTACEVYVSNSYLTSSGLRARTEWYQTNTVTKSRLDGKKLHLFGDGVCFGMGSSDIPTLSYPALLSSRYGIDIQNHALGDATIGVYDDEYLEERSVIKQIENSTINDGDLAIIFAGSNDYKSAEAKIGNDTDTNSKSFKGALNVCIQSLLLKNPKVKILIVAPLFRARLDADDFRNSDDTPINELTLLDYVNAMKDICEYNHIPFFNLHSNSMINKYNFTTYLKDRLYLNDDGHDMIADKIFSALDYYY